MAIDSDLDFEPEEDKFLHFLQYGYQKELTQNSVLNSKLNGLAQFGTHAWDLFLRLPGYLDFKQKWTWHKNTMADFTTFEKAIHILRPVPATLQYLLQLTMVSRGEHSKYLLSPPEAKIELLSTPPFDELLKTLGETPPPQFYRTRKCLKSWLPWYRYGEVEYSPQTLPLNTITDSLDYLNQIDSKYP